jgi:hypothetical protein
MRDEESDVAQEHIRRDGRLSRRQAAGGYTQLLLQQLQERLNTKSHRSLRRS